MRFKRLAACALAAVLALPCAALAQSIVTTTGAIPQTGADPGVVITAATTNCSSIKGSPGMLFSLSGLTVSSTVNYVRLYDLAAAPTANVSIPKHIFPVPAAAAGAVLPNTISPAGEAYYNGIGICVTGAGTSTDNTVGGTGTWVNYSYK